MDNNTFWIELWKYVTIVVVVLIVATVGSCQATKHKIQRMVEEGADPIIAACAVSDGGKPSVQLCMARVVQKN